MSSGFSAPNPACSRTWQNRGKAGRGHITGNCLKPQKKCHTNLICRLGVKWLNTKEISLAFTNCACPHWNENLGFLLRTRAHCIVVFSAQQMRSNYAWQRNLTAASWSTGICPSISHCFRRLTRSKTGDMEKKNFQHVKHLFQFTERAFQMRGLHSWFHYQHCVVDSEQFSILLQEGLTGGMIHSVSER